MQFEDEDGDLDLPDMEESTEADKSALGPSQESTQSKTDRESPRSERQQEDQQAKLRKKEELLRQEQEYQKETKERVQTNMFGYSDGSSSEDNQIDSSASTGINKKQPVETPYYNDLEELD